MLPRQAHFAKGSIDLAECAQIASGERKRCQSAIQEKSPGRIPRTRRSADGTNCAASERMDLNTVTEIARPRRRSGFAGFGARATPGLPAGRGCSPSRSSGSIQADRYCRSGLAGIAGERARLAHRRDLQDRRTRWRAFPSNWSAAPLVNQCCRSFFASFKIWNAGDSRRQSLHVVAGGTDDLAHIGAGRRVHDLDSGGRRAAASP